MAGSKNTKKAQAPTKIPTKINRKNHKTTNENRSIRANKTLKQLVILSIKSSDSQGLFFNQIKFSLKHGANVQVSNFILKLTLQQLLNSNHVVKSNQIYKLTGKSFNRIYRKKSTKTRLSRKSKKRVMKQAKEVRNTMKSTVSGLLNQKFKILEKVIMKAMRALKRKAVESKTRTGFMFNQVKAEVKKVAKQKKIRNIVLIKALENLRIDGSIQLKKGRNYLVKKKVVKPNKSGKKVASRKTSKKSKKLKKPKKSTKKEPKTDQSSMSKFIKNHLKVKKPAKTSKKATKPAKKIKRVQKTIQKVPKVERSVKIKTEPSTRRTVQPQKTDEEMSFYKQAAQKEEFSGDFGGDFSQGADYEQETFVVSDTEMGHFAEDILEEARRESRKELAEASSSE